MLHEELLCYFRHANLILNLFALMVDANVPDIALEPDKTVKKVNSVILYHGQVQNFVFPLELILLFSIDF